MSIIKTYLHNRRMRGAEKFNVKRFIYQLVLCAFTAIYLFPFYAVISLGVKSAKETLFNPLAFPTKINWQNFVKVWDKMDYSTTFMNSLTVTALSSIGIAILAGMCAFTIAKSGKKFYTVWYYIIISGLMIPFYMTLSSLMKLMRDLGLTNSLWGIIITYIGRSLPFAVFLYTGFIRSVPNELSEAARIDGCSVFQTYWLVIFPVTKHATSTLIILNVMTIWNDYLLPMLVLSKRKYQTIPVVQRLFYSEFNSQWNLAFAAFLLGMLPLMIFYFILQKNIVEGIAAGAVKG